MVRLALGFIAASFSLSALASDSKFDLADELYAQREGNIEMTQAARQEYLKIAQSSEGADLVRAVTSAARILVYEGEGLTTADDVETRKSIFRQCFDDVTPLMSKESLGFESPAYYYFTAACMAYYAEVSSTIENLKNFRRLNKILDSGLAIQGGDIFEGGGLKRVKAAVISNPKARPIPGGFYNPEAALQLINEATEGEAYPGNLPGNMFCENFRRKINVLEELDRIDEAKELASTTIEEFEFLLDLEEIPEVIISETRHCLNKVSEKLSSL